MLGGVVSLCETAEIALFKVNKFLLDRLAIRDPLTWSSVMLGNAVAAVNASIRLAMVIRIVKQFIKDFLSEM